MGGEFGTQAATCFIVSLPQKRRFFGVFAHDKVYLACGITRFSDAGDIPCDDFTAKNGNAGINAEFCAKVGYFYFLPTTDMPCEYSL